MQQLFLLVKKPLLAATLAGAVLGFGTSALAAASAGAPLEAAPGTRVMPGVLVFKLKAAVKSRAGQHTIEHAALRAALAAVGARDLTRQFPRAVPAAPERAARSEGVDLTLVYRIGYDARRPFAQVRQRLLASGAVAYVEPLYERAVCFQPNDPLADSTLSTGQYHLKNIRAYRAWDIEQGDTSVVIGITDTGTLFSHQDLQGQFAFNYADPINGLDDDNDGYVDNFRGWDVADHDNDPSVDETNIGNPQPKHGVLVSGAAAARVNNGKGVAGVGYKCRILPIKVYATQSSGGFAGFEGIVYAADHGCKVINCSWGGPGAYSQYEQDVITYATVNRDAVVVAAAGNTPADLDFYPASYKGVLSVCSVDRNDIKGASNTWSKRVSVSAPGRQIYTTHYINDTTYVTASGSSFASPIAAATAALVRSHFPAYSAAQATERVRITADTSIYALAGNANYQEMMGRGRINASRAVGEADVRSVRAEATHFNRAKPYYAGDTLLIWGDFRNYLAPLTGLTVTLTSASAYAQVVQPTFSAGPMGTMATATNAAQPFRVVLLPGTPLNAVVQLRYGFRDASGLRDYQYFKLEVNPDYVTLDANRVAATVTSRGNIGFDNGDPRRGDGVTFDRGDILLSEAGLLIGRDTAHVSDMIRSATPGRPDSDFGAVRQVLFQRPPAHPVADQLATGIFQDTTNPAPVGVRVVQRAWETHGAGRERVAFLEYDIINRAPDSLTAGRAGVFADWDIHQYEHNATAWNAARRLAYVYNVAHDSIYAGLKLLTGPGTVYAFDNYNPTAPINITDGLTTAEKYAALHPAPGAPQTAGVNASGSDVAHLVSAPLPALAPGDTAHLAWAIVTGRDLNELLAAADSAQALYDALQVAAPAPVALGAERCGPGAVTLTASGAPAGGAYRWYAQAGGAPIGGATGATYTTPSLTATTTYYVSTLTAIGRESVRVPVVATINALPVVGITITGDTTFCQGDSVRLTATGGDRYQWSNGDTTATIVVRAGALYSVTATNAARCAAASAPVQVTVLPIPAAPVLTATPQTGGLVLLTSDGGPTTQFLLNGVPVPGAVGTTYLVDPATQAGLYTATVTTTGGCVSPPSVGINVIVTGAPGAWAAAAVSLAPNPTTADVTLTLPVAARVVVVDALGRTVLDVAAAAGAQTLPFSRPAPGVYVVRITLPDGTALTRRLVKQ